MENMAKHGDYHKTHVAVKIVTELALAAVKAKGFKLTSPRKALISVLAAEHGPFTMEELHKKVVEEQGYSVDLVTVYRTMAMLEGLGVVAKCDFGEGFTRYEIAGEGSHHHHLVCRICKKAEPVDICPIEKGGILPKGHGFRDVTHRLEFFGVCPSC
jgi:Fur family ferric uptake transcriptional regulator